MPPFVSLPTPATISFIPKLRGSRAVEKSGRKMRWRAGRAKEHGKATRNSQFACACIFEDTFQAVHSNPYVVKVVQAKYGRPGLGDF
jgi:hypothetical protein